MQGSLSILLVDDDQDEYVLLKDMFNDLPGSSRNLSYTLEWVSNLDDAVRACEQKDFDLYIVDYYLGRHTAFDVMHALREQGCNAPVIVLTGQGSYEIDLEAMQRGAADFLLKSQLNEYLLERSIRYTLERSRINEELEARVDERTRELQDANLRLEQAFQSLAESETRFRTLAETTSAAIFFIQDRVIRYANPAARFITGYDPAELVGRELWTLAAPAYQGILKAERLGSQWAGNLPSRYEIKITHAGGEGRWLDVTAGEMSFDGRSGWLLTAFDITERDRAEHALQQAKADLEKRVEERTAEAVRRADELAGLHRATAALLSTLDLNTLFNQILAAAQSAIPAAERGLLFLTEAGDGEVEEKSERRPAGSAGQPLNLRAALGFGESETLPGPESCPQIDTVLATWKPIYVQDALSEDGEPDCPAPDARSLVAAPLLLEGKCLGVLALTASFPKAFTLADEALLVSFAVTTTAAIQNALLHASVLKMAASDPITGKYNRRAFFELGQREVDRYHTFHAPLSAVMIDLDNFKQINDTYGHAVGDQVLRELADRVRSCFRENDVFGRYGGDEFAILLPYAGIGEAVSIARRIYQAVTSAPVETARGPVRVTLSMGVAQIKPAHHELADLLRDADHALYRAKQRGKDRLEAWM